MAESNPEVDSKYTLSPKPLTLTNLKNTPSPKPKTQVISITEQKKADSSSIPASTSTPSPTSNPASNPQGEPHPKKLTKSGLKGKVFIGPTCAVVTEEADCEDKPFQANISILNPDDHSSVKSFQTDSQGHFQVDLAPGKYVVHPESVGEITFAPDQTVQVNPGEYTYVEVHYDTGVRIPPISVCYPPNCPPAPGYCKDFQCKIDDPVPSTTPSPSSTPIPLQVIEVTDPLIH